MITIREAAEIHGASKQLVHSWIKAGHLPAQWVAAPGVARGALWLIRRADVLAYVPARGPYRGRKRNIDTPADQRPESGQEAKAPTLPELPPGQPATTTLDPVGLPLTATAPQPDPTSVGYLS